MLRKLLGLRLNGNSILVLLQVRIGSQDDLSHFQRKQKKNCFVVLNQSVSIKTLNYATFRFASEEIQRAKVAHFTALWCRT